MTDRPVLQVKGLRVSFATQNAPARAVEDLNFEVMAGETLCIVGESGSGKSATSLSLMRLVEFGGGRIESGKILFDASDGGPVDLAQLDASKMRHLRGNQIAMIFQEPMTALNPVFTIARQLSEGVREHQHLSAQQARAWGLELLRAVNIPEPERRLNQYPHELSGGMRQRVVIAMAMACNPKVLIADEPTTALDVSSQAEILALINRLKDETGAAVVFVTHDMAVVAQMADRVIVMKDGQKVEEGTVDQVFSSPNHPYTRALLKAVPILSAGQSSPVVQEANPKPLLRVEGLSVRFPVKGGVLRRNVAQVHAVEDVSFALGRARTLSLVGESGSGKSTTGRAILRLVDPVMGKITLEDQVISSLRGEELRRARMNMQMVFQDPYGSLNPKRQVGDQVAEPLLNFATTAKQGRDRTVEKLFDRVGLPSSYLKRYPHELSGGQRQRVAIARALALNPSLIVADEAVSALDVSVQDQVLTLLKELQNELGFSYLFISHDMAVVERVSHEIAVMYAGRIVEIGPSAAVLGNPQHPYTRALLRAVPHPDPFRRTNPQSLNRSEAPSLIHPVGYDPAPSIYRDAGDGHKVLTSPGWGAFDGESQPRKGSAQCL